MANWLEEMIQKAMAEGQFDDLPLQGKPLNLQRNPYEDPNSHLAHRIIKQSGETLPWIAERNLLLEAIEKAKAKLAREWTWYRDGASVEARKKAERVLEAFRQTAAVLNKRVRDFNLKAPTPSVHVFHVDVEREIGRVTGAEGQPLSRPM